MHRSNADAEPAAALGRRMTPQRRLQLGGRHIAGPWTVRVDLKARLISDYTKMN
jgi:hypothetical protein